MSLPSKAEWDHYNERAARLPLARAYVGIGTHKLIDTAARRRAVRDGDVPGSVAEFTSEWLTAILCRQCPGARVISFTPGGISSGSTDRQAFTVVYNDVGRQAGLPTRFFNKYTGSLKIRVFMKLAGTLENEVGFYREIRPELEIETPKVYHAAIDRRSWRSTIILEDVSASRGAVFLDTKERVSKSLIESMLALLAAIHGRYWNSPRLDSQFKWLRTPLQWVMEAGPMIHLRARTIAGALAARAIIPDELIAYDGEIWRAFGASLAASSRLPRTLLHGDAHIGNYYRTDKGAPGLVDWQVTHKGSWEFDFAYTLLTCLAIEDRRNWQEELLRFYLEQLRAAGAEPPGFDDAWQAYCRQTLYTYVGWLCTLGAQYQQPRSTTMDVIKRAGTAIVDLQSMKRLAY